MKHNRFARQVLWIIIFAAIPAPCLHPEYSVLTSEDLFSIELQVQREVNEVRQTARIPKLNWNEKLTMEARRHAKNMAGRQFFSHYDSTRGDLSHRLDRSGIEWTRCAENLYSEKGFHNPAKHAVQVWLESPEHRKNMLDSMLSDAGVGAALQSDGTLFIVHVFILK
jgi:uncharacterized protein YkwD